MLGNYKICFLIVKFYNKICTSCLIWQLQIKIFGKDIWKLLTCTIADVFCLVVLNLLVTMDPFYFFYSHEILKFKVVLLIFFRILNMGF